MPIMPVDGIMRDPERILAGAESSMPSPGNQGRIFVAIDTQRIYEDNGTTWVKVGAAGDLISHLAETMITTNKTINVPGDFSTIQAALDSLKKAWISKDVTVTIQVAAGTFNHTTPIIVDHPCGSRIRIIGAAPVTTTITGNGTVTGSADNWSVPILVQSTSGIAAGDYVIIKDTTGLDDHYAFRGIWKVVSVDSATQITVQNTHRASAFPMAALSGGTVVALKTILKFTACNGIVVAPNSALGFLDQVAVVGDGSINTGILVGRVSFNQAVPGPAFILLGSNVGVNGFGADGIWVGYGGAASAYSGVASSGNGYNGFSVGNGGSIWAGSNTASGNGGHGFVADSGGSIRAGSSTASGNGGHGFWAVNSGSIWAGYSTASGNGYNGFWADNGSSIWAGSSTASGNGQNGFAAVNGGSIWAGYSTASGNGGHGFWADNGSSIWAYYSTANGNGQNGFAADNGGSIRAGYSTAVDNKNRGFTVNNGGTIVAVNSTASGNTNYDYYAWLESSIYAYGYTGTPTFSPAANTVGNANAIIVT